MEQDRRKCRAAHIPKSDLPGILCSTLQHRLRLHAVSNFHGKEARGHHAQLSTWLEPVRDLGTQSGSLAVIAQPRAFAFRHDRPSLPVRRPSSLTDQRGSSLRAFFACIFPCARAGNPSCDTKFKESWGHTTPFKGDLMYACEMAGHAD